MDKHITAPFDKKQVEELHAGDYVYISGVIYSARDAAHKRMYDTLIENENDESKLPIKLEGNVIYYLGPTPAREGQVIAVGGAGALLSKCIKKSEVVAYDDLGTEAIRKMTVENLPVIVVIDSKGNNLYETAVADYLKQQE